MLKDIAILEFGSFGSNLYIKPNHQEQGIQKSFLNALNLVNPDDAININVFKNLLHQITKYLELNDVDFSIVNGIATGIYRSAINWDVVKKTLNDAGIQKVSIISQKKELEYSFGSFFGKSLNLEGYSNVKYFDIGGGSIEYGQYIKGKTLNYIDGVSFGVLHGVNALFHIPPKSRHMDIESSFMRLRTMITHQTSTLKYNFDYSKYEPVYVIGGSTPKNLRKRYHRNDYLDYDQVKEFVESELSKVLGIYKNIKHLERFYKTKQSVRTQLRTLIGGLIVQHIMDKFDIQYFEVNRNSLLDGVMRQFES